MLKTYQFTSGKIEYMDLHNEIDKLHDFLDNGNSFNFKVSFTIEELDSDFTQDKEEEYFDKLTKNRKGG